MPEDLGSSPYVGAKCNRDIFLPLLGLNQGPLAQQSWTLANELKG